MNILNDFAYYEPKSKNEAIEMLVKEGEGAKLLAGGTDLVIMMKEQMIAPSAIINILKLDELKGIEVKAGKGAEIGACTTIRDIEFSSKLKEKYPALTYAAGELGSNQVRVMATLGGNCCHSSPAAETPTPLSALGAQAVISGPKGDRQVKVEEFITGNRRNVLGEGELLSKFVLPEPEKNSACRYGYIGLRKAMEIDAVNMAVNVVLEEDKETIKETKLVMGSVSPRPLVSQLVPSLVHGKKLDQALIEEVGRAAQKEAKPISDIRASAEYRKDVVGALARRLIKEAYEAAKEA